jgi:hypothetical protein
LDAAYPIPLKVFTLFIYPSLFSSIPRVEYGLLGLKLEGKEEK